MKSRFAQGVFLVFVTVVLWGVQFPVAKDAFAAVDAFHVTAIRYVLGALVLIALLVWLEGTAALSYYGRAWPASLFGFVGMCCSPMLVFFGIAALAGYLSHSTTVFVAVVALGLVVRLGMRVAR